MLRKHGFLAHFSLLAMLSSITSSFPCHSPLWTSPPQGAHPCPSHLLASYLNSGLSLWIFFLAFCNFEIYLQNVFPLYCSCITVWKCKLHENKVLFALFSAVSPVPGRVPGPQKCSPKREWKDWVPVSSSPVARNQTQRLAKKWASESMWNEIPVWWSPGLPPEWLPHKRLLY